MNITLHTRLLLLAAAALVAGPASQAHAAKAPAPKLTIDDKLCKTGASPEERYAVVTATAVVGASSDRVALRFAMQEENTKGRWVSVLDIGGTFGSWEVSEPGRDGLRFTKTIDGLGEAVSYRVVVQARGVDAAGKVVTKTARRYVSCNQPQITPYVKILKLLAGDDPSIKPDSVPVGTDASSLVLDLRNTGRSKSAPITVTLRHARTGELFAQIGREGLEPKLLYRSVTTRPRCVGRIEVTVREDDTDASATPAADQVATIPCAPLAAQARRR